MTGTKRNSAGETRGRPFQPGNPGKPRGARNKATLAVEALLEGEAEAIGRRVVELALSGDSTALRLCLERIAPVRKGRPVRLDLPRIATTADLAEAQAVVLAAMAGGEISPEEAADVAKILEALGASMERRDLEARIKALEERGNRA